MAKEKSKVVYHGYGAAGLAAATVGNTMQAFDRLEWTMLTIGSILSGFACVWIASLLGIPREPHFNGSLLIAGAPVAAILGAVVAILVSMLIGSLTSWFVEREAGLFCCCLGIAALGVRCGPIRPVLQYSTSSSVFISLAIEAAVLGTIVIAGWIGLRKVLDGVASKLTSADFTVPNEKTDATLQQKLATLGVQMLAMGIVELILIQTDAKAQAMAGVFIAAYVGSLAAYSFTPLAEGIWYWAGPVALAVISYVFAYFGADLAATGDLHGWTAALVRATPLDYTGMGTAGALLGYWSVRRWMQPQEEGEEETAAV